jgi:insulysin
MLFVGSTKYPEMGYFDNLVSEAGYSNAYTEPTHTNFYFEVSSSRFTEALDAFS